MNLLDKNIQNFSSQRLISNKSILNLRHLLSFPLNTFLSLLGNQPRGEWLDLILNNKLYIFRSTLEQTTDYISNVGSNNTTRPLQVLLDFNMLNINLQFIAFFTNSSLEISPSPSWSTASIRSKTQAARRETRPHHSGKVCCLPLESWKCPTAGKRGSSITNPIPLPISVMEGMLGEEGEIHRSWNKQHYIFKAKSSYATQFHANMHLRLISLIAGIPI